MSRTDNKPGAEPIEPDDAMSATGMFLGGFQPEPDPFDVKDPAPTAQPARPAPRGAGPGEFTQLFDPLPTKPAPAAPVSPPNAGPGEVTRVFAPPAATKMRGFSSPGASDSASAEGSFTQVFRTPPSPAPRPPLPVKPSPPPAAVERREWEFDPSPASQASQVSDSMGVTSLFRALSGNEAQADSFPEQAPPSAKSASPTPPAESFTMLLRKLTENVPASQNFETQQLAPAPAAGEGEFTRIITRGPTTQTSAVPASPAATPEPVKMAMPKLEAPAAPAAPKLAVPAMQPPKTKLQEMVPILLVLNAFLMVVLIALVVFALMHR